MKHSKNDLIRCLVWLRNGTSFCYTWLLMLGIALCRINRIEALSVELLFRSLLLVCGAVALFCFWFSPFPFPKMRFITRLTGFFLLLTPFELLSFYWLGVFQRSETTTPRLMIFLCIALGFYLLCLAIDRLVCTREGNRYTEKLKMYQQQKEGALDDK